MPEMPETSDAPTQPAHVSALAPIPTSRGLYQKVRSFYIAPHPEPTGGWAWGCEDCPAMGHATTTCELGGQIAAHTADCPG